MELEPDMVGLRMPDLELEPLPTRVSAWLKPLNAEVVEGERILEIESGDVIIDLPAPASGRIVEQLVQDDEVVTAGQMLAIIALCKEPAHANEELS